MTQESPIRHLYDALDASLQTWGRFMWPSYGAFEPLVELRLAVVEQRAAELRDEEPYSGEVTVDHRRRAAWDLVRRAIETLRTGLGEPPAEIEALLSRHQANDRGPPVPHEWQPYVLFRAAYVEKSHSRLQLAHLFRCSPRLVATIRRSGLERVARCLDAWERGIDAPQRPEEGRRGAACGASSKDENSL
jgi:hypothetical protein